MFWKKSFIFDRCLSTKVIKGGNIIFFTKFICILFLDKPNSESKVNNAE